MKDIKLKLESFNTRKLIDIVKNYKQYGYDNDLRTIAINILEKRGIDREELKRFGHFKNHSYESAKGIYKSFGKNSKIAFVLYILVLLLNILTSLFAQSSTILAAIISWILSLLYLLFLVKSFINQNEFYKVRGKENDSSSILIYVLLGLPFYIFAYFFFRNQMNDEMKMIK